MAISFDISLTTPTTTLPLLMEVVTLLLGCGFRGEPHNTIPLLGSGRVVVGAVFIGDAPNMLGAGVADNGIIPLSLGLMLMTSLAKSAWEMVPF